MTFFSKYLSATALACAATSATAFEWDDALVYGMVSGEVFSVGAFRVEEGNTIITGSEFDLLSFSGVADFQLNNFSLALSGSRAYTKSTSQAFDENDPIESKDTSQTGVRFTFGYDATPWLTPYAGLSHHAWKENVSETFYGFEYEDSFSGRSVSEIFGLEIQLTKLAFAAEVVVDFDDDDAWETARYKLGAEYSLQSNTSVFGALQYRPNAGYYVGENLDLMLGLDRETDRYEAYVALIQKYEEFDDEWTELRGGLTWKFNNGMKAFGAFRSVLADPYDSVRSQSHFDYDLGLGYDISDRWSTQLTAKDIGDYTTKIELRVTFETDGKRLRLMDRIADYQRTAGISF